VTSIVTCVSVEGLTIRSIYTTEDKLVHFNAGNKERHEHNCNGYTSSQVFAAVQG
jgi:hypothetical protein